jgi:AcrR family transcriptional regulator/predicted DNA-binding transcriptional regulator AlpA
MRPLTITQLERDTGVGRSTIYYYISEGLLPPAQKASATRAVYDQSHVDLLRDITKLKAEGIGLREIQDLLSDRIAAAADSDVDLVAKQNEETRTAILQTAARFFAQRGYEKTRIGDICKEVGVTAQLLYSHFPSKRHLFIACYEVYFAWMHAKVTPPIEATDDSAARMAWRNWASYGIRALSPDLQAMARLEAIYEESELRPLVRAVYEQILEGTKQELAADRQPGANPGLFDDELLSYAFLGALENMQMRSSWDDRYNKRDVMRNLVAMFLAVRAAYSGLVDLTADWQAVAGLVDRLAVEEPGFGETGGRARARPAG